MNNTTQQHRIVKDSNFTIISNELINNDNLDTDSKMIMIYLLSKPNNWNIVANEVQKSLRMSRGKCSAGFKSLINSGYILRSMNRNDKGQLIGWNYELIEKSLKSAQIDESNQTTNNRMSDNRMSDSGTLLITDITNTNTILPLGGIVLPKEENTKQVVLVREEKVGLVSKSIIAEALLANDEYVDVISRYMASIVESELGVQLPLTPKALTKISNICVANKDNIDMLANDLNIWVSKCIDTLAKKPVPVQVPAGMFSSDEAIEGTGVPLVVVESPEPSMPAFAVASVISKPLNDRDMIDEMLEAFSGDQKYIENRFLMRLKNVKKFYELAKSTSYADAKAATPDSEINPKKVC